MKKVVKVVITFSATLVLFIILINISAERTSLHTGTIIQITEESIAMETTDGQYMTLSTPINISSLVNLNKDYKVKVMEKGFSKGKILKEIRPLN